MVPLSIFKPNDKRQGDLRLDDLELTVLPMQYDNVTGHCIVSNNKLISLEGSPRIVGGGFYCYQNELTSLAGCPEEVGGDFSCGHNAVEFTEEYVRSLCKVKGRVYE